MPQGHPDYRFICQEMWRKIQEVHPALAQSRKFIDWQKYRLKRLQSEMRSEYKRSAIETKQLYPLGGANKNEDFFMPRKTKTLFTKTFSQGGSHTEDIDAAWAAEVERRSDQLKQAVVRPILWADVKRHARKRVYGP